MAAQQAEQAPSVVLSCAVLLLGQGLLSLLRKLRKSEGEVSL